MRPPTLLLDLSSALGLGEGGAAILLGLSPVCAQGPQTRRIALCLSQPESGNSEVGRVGLDFGKQGCQKHQDKAFLSLDGCAMSPRMGAGWEEVVPQWDPGHLPPEEAVPGELVLQEKSRPQRDGVCLPYVKLTACSRSVVGCPRGLASVLSPSSPQVRRSTDVLETLLAQRPHLRSCRPVRW